MNWEQFWNNTASQTDNLSLQVGRSVNGVPADDKTLNEIIVHISTLLKIQNTDNVLDVCCGNGMLTTLLADKCKTIVGVDLSEKLIAEANQKNIKLNIVYQKANAVELDELFVENQFDKINLYFSFQYFENIEIATKLISSLLYVLKPGGSILLGDIPDYNKKYVFYNSFEKKFRLFVQNIKGTNTMGKFWNPSELESICKKLGASSQTLNEPTHLPYSHYRFDFLIKKS